MILLLMHKLRPNFKLSNSCFASKTIFPNSLKKKRIYKINIEIKLKAMSISEIILEIGYFMDSSHKILLCWATLSGKVKVVGNSL